MRAARCRPAALGAGLAVAVALAGCSVDQARVPECPSGPDADVSTLTLMAQAVPDAALVPCIDAYAAGWSFEGAEIEDGRGRFWLESDRAGNRALQVILEARCDTSGAVEVPSDEEGARRFEEVQDLEAGYRGRRAYLLPGGCVTYRFEFSEGRPSTLLNEASLMLTFVSRDELRERIRDDTDGLVDDGP
jgi:hypothetical protein